MKNLIALVATLGLLATACGSSVFSLGVGDCFNDPDSTEVSRVETVGCDEAHDNEVYAAVAVTQASFPGEDGMRGLAEEGCLSRFETFVGNTYQESALFIGYLTPTLESWNDDDREIVCYLYAETGPRTGTARNSGL